MAYESSIHDRLSFLQIDEATRSVLKDFLPLVQAELPVILEKFYTHIRTYPQLANMFGTGAQQQARMKHAADAQEKHWLRLFSGSFDEDYVTSVRKIGLIHSQIGLEPRWYIGAYAFTAIENIGKTIGQINQISSTIAAAVQEQTAATSEISRNVQQAAQGTEEISSGINKVTTASVQTGTTSTQVLTSSDLLAQQATHLDGEVDKFLVTIKAA